jgi:hypothetical protein
LEAATECGSHRRQHDMYVAMSQVPRVTNARCGNSNSATAPTAASAAGAAAAATTAATPTAGGTAATKAHAASGSADEAPIEPEHQRATAAPNTAQRIGPCSATPQTSRGLSGEWR